MRTNGTTIYHGGLDDQIRVTANGTRARLRSGTVCLVLTIDGLADLARAVDEAADVLGFAVEVGQS